MNEPKPSATKRPEDRRDVFIVLWPFMKQRSLLYRGIAYSVICKGKSVNFRQYAVVGLVLSLPSDTPPSVGLFVDVSIARVTLGKKS